MRQGDAVAWRQPNGKRVYGVIVAWNGHPDQPVTVLDRDGAAYRPFAQHCEEAIVCPDGIPRFPNGVSALDLVEAVAGIIGTAEGKQAVANTRGRRTGYYPVDDQGRVGRFRVIESWYGQEQESDKGEVEEMRRARASKHGLPEVTDIPLTVAEGRTSWPTAHLLKRLSHEREGDRLLAAVSNDRYREFLRRRFLLGESTGEIAKRLGISADTAGRLGRRALTQLRRSLDGDAAQPCAA